MKKEFVDITDEIKNTQNITKQQLKYIFADDDKENAEYLFKTAREVADKVFNKDVYLRGLIEFTNYCKNDCYYCGIRCSNRHADRYRLSEE